MSLPPKTTHPKGETLSTKKSQLPAAIDVDTYGGKVHIEWDPDATVTPLGQLPFFIQFLKSGGRFDPWVNDCPLTRSALELISKLWLNGHHNKNEK